MPAFQTTAALAALKTTVSKVFRERTALTPQTKSLGLYSVVPSTSKSNTYDWLADLAGLNEWIGPRAVEGMKERSFVAVNRHFQKTIGLDRNSLDDSPDSAIGDMQMRLEMLLEQADLLEDDLILNPSGAAIPGLLALGASTVCYDGQFFFDTDHPVELDGVISGTQSNYEASAFALTSANFQTARARMMAFRGEGGRSRRAMPNLLVVPPALEKAAHDIVTAQFGSSGASNVQAGMAQVKVIPELSQISDTRWFLFDTISPGPKPFLMQVRSPLNLVQKTSETDDNVFHDREYLWGVDRRLVGVYGLWHRAFSGSA